MDNDEDALRYFSACRNAQLTPKLSDTQWYTDVLERNKGAFVRKTPRKKTQK